MCVGNSFDRMCVWYDVFVSHDSHTVSTSNASHLTFRTYGDHQNLQSGLNWSLMCTLFHYQITSMLKLLKWQLINYTIAHYEHKAITTKV